MAQIRTLNDTGERSGTHFGSENKDAQVTHDFACTLAHFYKATLLGCCLSPILEDGSISDEVVAKCLTRATESNHARCFVLGQQFRTFNEADRLCLITTMEQLNAGI